MATTKWCSYSDCDKRGDNRADYNLLGGVHCTEHALDNLRHKCYTLSRKNDALIEQRNKLSEDLARLVYDLGVGWMVSRHKFDKDRDRDEKVCWCGQ